MPPVAPTRSSDRYVDRRAGGGDRRGPGQEKGLFRPKSGSDKAVTGVTGGSRVGLQNSRGADRGEARRGRVRTRSWPTRRLSIASGKPLEGRSGRGTAPPAPPEF